MGNIHLTGPSIMSNVPLTNNNIKLCMWKTQWSPPKRFTLQRLTLRAFNIDSITEKPFQIYAIARRSIMRWYFAICQNIQVIYCLCLFAHFRALTSFRIQCLPKFSWNSQCFLLLKSRGVFTSREIEHSCFEGSVHLSRTNH